jgi:hypothetical protein
MVYDDVARGEGVCATMLSDMIKWVNESRCRFRNDRGGTKK